jgi:TetR/AcrR family transcriptional repressor of nem operon
MLICARAEIADSFRCWETVIRRDLRFMHERGELAPEANPDELAVATLAALQGGLLLAQVQRSTKPLEAALDAIVSLITMLSAPPVTRLQKET